MMTFVCSYFFGTTPIDPVLRVTLASKVTEVEAGCDALYATFCAQVWGAGAMMDGW